MTEEIRRLKHFNKNNVSIFYSELSWFTLLFSLSIKPFYWDKVPPLNNLKCRYFIYLFILLCSSKTNEKTQIISPNIRSPSEPLCRYSLLVMLICTKCVSQWLIEATAARSPFNTSWIIKRRNAKKVKVEQMKCRCLGCGSTLP